jgi:SNW domain-containing protein 1
MSIFLSSLPIPKTGPTPEITNPITERRIVIAGKAPPYGKRKGWIPRTTEDYADGGAFPEIHVAQYPLDMGKKGGDAQKTVPLNLDSSGRIKYDAILGPREGKIVQSRFNDSKETNLEEESLKRPDPEKEAEVTSKTRAALEHTVNLKITATQPTAISGVTSGSSPNEAKYIRYNPTQKGNGLNSGADTRIIRMTEMPSDPLEPPKFKNKKVPNGPPSPPVPVMHSPPRKLTMKDQQDWKIPPCISNWKNNKGYTIPLDKRLAADGRGLQEIQINDNFAKLSESLYIAERVAREEVAKRAEIEKRLKLKEKEKKEEMLRKLAQEARLERASSQATSIEDEETESARRERDQIRASRKRELERDLRMQRNKSIVARNEDRDISERIALGQTVVQSSSETMYDQRLFNQSEGISSGFGDEDSYNVYSKPLFHGSSANQLYRPKKASDTETYGGEEDFKKLLDTSKFKADKNFTGVDNDKAQAPRDKPVEFEKGEDPFGLDEFLSAAKTSGKSKALDKIGTSNHMHASSGNASTDGSSSKRNRIDFEKPSSKQSDDRNSSKKHHRV